MSNGTSRLVHQTETGKEVINRIAAATASTDPALKPPKRIAKKKVKKRAPRVTTHARDTTIPLDEVDDRVRRAALENRKPGQKIVVVDRETVRIVNIGGGA